MLMATAKHLLRRLLAGLRSWPPCRRRRQAPKTRVVIRRFGAAAAAPASPSTPPVTIRVATFNAAMFSMAPAAATAERDGRCTVAGDDCRPRRRQPPKGILKAQQSLARTAKKMRVSINLQDNEISRTAAAAAGSGSGGGGGGWKGKAAAAEGGGGGGRRSVEEVLREVGADIIGLQNVRAEEERGMRPLSEVAEGLGMRYAFAESWAPEYGNAVLSRWPIKRWKAQRIADQSDFRNVLRATIEVPGAGEVNFHCTHLDHLDESWRMKQLNSILRFAADGPHILAGGLNALDETDYSAERWADIVKYYEEIGKPTPKAEVMKYLKGKQYVDAKDFAGECEAVVVVAKGQDVQGTCKYGTRVDYILASPNSPYKFVPGSYAVLSSKGTSDHHIVKADITIAKTNDTEAARKHPRRRVVKMSKASSRGIWAAR